MDSEHDHLEFSMPQYSYREDQVIHPFEIPEQKTQNEVGRQGQFPTTRKSPVTPQAAISASHSSAIDGSTTPRVSQTSAPNAQVPHDSPFMAPFLYHVLHNVLIAGSHDDSEYLQTSSASGDIDLIFSQDTRDILERFTLDPMQFSSGPRDVQNPSLSDASLVACLAEQQTAAAFQDEQQGPWTSLNSILVSPHDPSWPEIPFEIGYSNFGNNLGPLSMSSDSDGTEVGEADIATIPFALLSFCPQLAWLHELDFSTSGNDIEDVGETPEFPSQNTVHDADPRLQEQWAGIVDLFTSTVPQAQSLEFIDWDVLWDSKSHL